MKRAEVSVGRGRRARARERGRTRHPGKERDKAYRKGAVCRGRRGARKGGGAQSCGAGRRKGGPPRTKRTKKQPGVRGGGGLVWL